MPTALMENSSLQVLIRIISLLDTPRKINVEPENDGLENGFPFPRVYSQVLC